MRAFLVVVLLLAVGIGITGFALGWFNVSTDPDKIKKDRDSVVALFQTSRSEFQKQTETRLEGMDRKLDELKTKAKTAGAETKDQLNEAITELGKKTQVARTELKELGASTKEGYDAVKTRLNASLDDLQGGLDKAGTRFQ